MQNILISTECVADLPAEIVKDYNIGIVYYTVKTDMGEFRDTDEITASNVMEYMMGGSKKALSVIPSVNHYRVFFEQELTKYDEIIHISISGDVSEACANAREASRELGEEGGRIRVIDSRHLSSGQGLLVLEAAKLNAEGKSADEIEQHVKDLIPKISTSFLAYNADYLYYNDKVSKRVMEICQKFQLHPVLGMNNGKLSLTGVYIGRYEAAEKSYIKKATKKAKDIRKDVGFITYAGCTHKNLDDILAKVQKKVGFDVIYEQPASASISCNCGPNTFGVLYIRD